ncbi:MAG: histidine phosphatase family protein [Candidatus Nanopelagicales bacterium]
MTRTLYVLRHAKSDYPPGVPDIDRPLGPRGRRDAPVAGRWLATASAPVTQAIVSPARRTRQTWELASSQFPTTVPIATDGRIYAAHPEQLLAVITTMGDDPDGLVLVGHNPGCEELADLLAGPGSDADAGARMEVKYPTAAIAVLESDAPWPEWTTGSARLIDFVVPRG